MKKTIKNVVAPSLYESFDTPEHRAWKEDRLLRQRLPLSQAWRGCVGLGAMLADPQLSVDCGDARFVPNSNVTWLSLRDIPVGRFPGSAMMNRREVNFASSTQATIRYGMPSIDFTRFPRESMDFRFMPFGRYRRRIGAKAWDHYDIVAAGDTLNSADRPREFAILNHLSAAMTQHAYCGVDASGRPLRPAWAAMRTETMGDQGVLSLREWFPRAYLGFPVQQLAELLDLATVAQPEGRVLHCRRCGSDIDSRVFERRHRALGLHHCEEGGDIIANCPVCHRRQKWSAADGAVARTVRQYPLAFQEQFCDAVTTGLPLHSVGPSVYSGPVRFVPERDLPNLPDAQIRRLELVPHKFLNTLTGERYFVYLPTTACLEARKGELLSPGQRWCHALPSEPEEQWANQNRAGQWNSLTTVAGGVPQLRLLQMIWLRHQAVMHEDLGDHQFLLPADLLGLAGGGVPPTCLFWDFKGAVPYLNDGLRAAIFPPLRLHHWDDLRFQLPGDVAMNASIADPRFGAHAPRLLCESQTAGVVAEQLANDAGTSTLRRAS